MFVYCASKTHDHCIIYNRDSERKRKVKEIYHQLATQEGEVRALKRLKDKL